ncbi:hypothetical protein ACHAWF_005940 [Thalassiosira exigua]
MKADFCFLLAVFALRLIGASSDTTTSIRRCRINHSHTFHLEPRAIIESALSDLRGQPFTTNEDEDGDGVPVDIDMSSARLGDGGLVSFVDGLISILNSKISEAGDELSNEKSPLLIKLILEMNKITPSGAFGLFSQLSNATSQIESDDIEMNEKDVDRASQITTNEANETGSDNSTTFVEGETSTETSPGTATPLPKQPPFMIEDLDLSSNDIGGHGIHAPNAKLFESVRRLFEGGRTAFVPRILTVENCAIGPAFCRSVGRGILNAYEKKKMNHRPSMLRLGGNEAIGDAGTVALAAALRLAMGNGISEFILEELDLQSCNVGDTGAEALALALATNHGCLSRLDLSNNRITDAGSKALGRGIVDARQHSGAVLEEIILDGNTDIGDEGAAALAEALSCGGVKSISMRSCNVRAQGMSAFGKALISLSQARSSGKGTFAVDLSGNHFGTKRVKKKKGAASVFRDKASTNIKFIGKSLKGAYKRFGSETMGLTAESDDDEEVMGGLVEDAEEVDGDKLQACGGHAFAAEIIRPDVQESQLKEQDSLLKIKFGMRQCSLDEGAIDALAASIIGAGHCELSIDVRMNGLEDSVENALIKAKKDSELLTNMAQRYTDLLDRIADARQRQLEAGESGDFGGTFFDDEDSYDPYDDLD